MVPNDFVDNFYLIFLRLSHCNISTLTTVHFPNLRHLDLSHNQLPNVKNMAVLPMLKKLLLSHNPFLMYVHTPTLEKLSFLSLSHSPRLASWTSDPLPLLHHIDLRQSAPTLPSPSLLPSITSLKMAGGLIGEVTVAKGIDPLLVLALANVKVAEQLNLDNIIAKTAWPRRDHGTIHT